MADELSGGGRYYACWPQRRHGNNIALVIKLKNGIEKTILVPVGLFAGFVTALFAAGSEAHRAQLARFGTQQGHSWTHWESLHSSLQVFLWPKQKMMPHKRI